MLALAACTRADADGPRVRASAVTGASWLSRNGIAIASTPMGHMGTDAPPPSTTSTEPMPTSGRERFEITGADLYRYTCQSCHGPRGEGAPPTIHSILGPAAAMSPALAAARFADAGAPVDPTLLRQLTSQAERAFRDRVRKGGQKMPGLADLRPNEVDALAAYAESLAGAPATPRTLSEPALRVGELVAEGTCHVCHDATGPGGPRYTMMSGNPPSLASLPRDYTLGQVVAKVRFGRGVGMGMMGMGGMGMGRGRGMGMGMGMGRMGRRTIMPAYPYLSPQEIAATMLYLRRVPPRP